MSKQKNVSIFIITIVIFTLGALLVFADSSPLNSNQKPQNREDGKFTSYDINSLFKKSDEQDKKDVSQVLGTNTGIFFPASFRPPQTNFQTGPKVVVVQPPIIEVSEPKETQTPVSYPVIAEDNLPKGSDGGVMPPLSFPVENSQDTDSDSNTEDSSNKNNEEVNDEVDSDNNENTETEEENSEDNDDVVEEEEEPTLTEDNDNILEDLEDEVAITILQIPISYLNIVNLL